MRAIELRSDHLRVLDQTRLPQEVRFEEYRNPEEIATALREMKIRGAPLIGLAGAMTLVLVARHNKGKSREEILSELHRAAEPLLKARPTGRDLYTLTERMLSVASEASDICSALEKELERIQESMEEISRKLGAIGATLIGNGQTVLTHCNTGFLAAPGEGTALAAIKFAWRSGKRIRVFVTETRPLLQGARLTLWELQREGIPATLIVDSAAGYCMQRGMVHIVMVGADRILPDGSVINKIGTYTLAVLAKRHGIPFYVVAPFSTFDPKGEVIVEERGKEEVLPQDWGLKVEVFNPAFDLTPPELITGVVTERGILGPQEVGKFAKD
jgi:S-methyl-5-thioribose-1-phosphate isomerase